MAYKKVTVIQGKSGYLEINGESAYEQVDRQVKSNKQDIYINEDIGSMVTERIIRASDIEAYYVKDVIN
ncbi:hypothetical protein [Stenotrophomonas phage vB_SmeS_BUCT704]|nr:hypothetical protein [Stenotrophomonas phage vB_SmeS_BUCT702]UUG68414.1 hypothetical protein [Stenotrophomonas phage vB_SmeS_BUCT704]